MFLFKNSLQLGVATASAQIEGGDPGSNWNRWCDLGKIRDHSNISRANDHWNRYREDIALLEELGIRNYRMSVEWARIEPQPGEFSEEAIRHYRDEIGLMKSKGIHVLLTLWHFSHPQWFEDKGGFAPDENVDLFLRYVAHVVDRLGDLVDDYCTLNEPNVYAVNCFFFGDWLNEEKSFLKTIRVLNRFISCHLEAYQLIHQIQKAHGRPEPRVSFAHHMRLFTPARENAADRLGVKILNHLFQQGFFRAAALGEFVLPFKNLRHFPRGRYLDRIAINYYSRGEVRLFSDTVKDGVPKNDLGWEIYPQGLIDCARQCHDLLPLPIVISENGTCDNQDDFRPLYLYEHLKAIGESDLPITHYYHWCFLDNFEWQEGERARFGLVHCDYETQKRTLKQSALMYRDVIQAGGFTKEIYDRYVAGCRYHHGERHAFPERQNVSRR